MLFKAVSQNVMAKVEVAVDSQGGVSVEIGIEENQVGLDFYAL